MIEYCLVVAKDKHNAGMIFQKFIKLYDNYKSPRHNKRGLILYMIFSMFQFVQHAVKYMSEKFHGVAQ